MSRKETSFDFIGERKTLAEINLQKIETISGIRRNVIIDISRKKRANEDSPMANERSALVEYQQIQRSM